MGAMLTFMTSAQRYPERAHVSTLVRDCAALQPQDALAQRLHGGEEACAPTLRPLGVVSGPCHHTHPALRATTTATTTAAAVAAVLLEEG